MKRSKYSLKSYIHLMLFKLYPFYLGQHNGGGESKCYIKYFLVLLMHTFSKYNFYNCTIWNDLQTPVILVMVVGAYILFIL